MRRAPAGLVLALLALLPAAAHAADPPVYAPVPEGTSLRGGLTVDAAGDAWAGAGTADFKQQSLVHVTRAGAASVETLPAVTGEGCCATQVVDVAADRASGRVWFVRNTGAYGFRLPAGGFQSAILASKKAFGGIAIGAGGRAWATEKSAYHDPDTGVYSGNRAVELGPDLSARELPGLETQGGSSRFDAKPSGITVAPDGAPWFTEEDAGNPGYRIAKVTGTGYEEHQLPCCSGVTSGTGPTTIAAATDGSLWWTNPLNKTIGRYVPATQAMSEFKLASFGLAGSTPRTIRAAPDGTLWFTATGSGTGNALVRVVPTATPTADVLRTGTDRTPLGIAPGIGGDLWFTTGDYGSPALGRIAGAIAAAPVGTGGGSGDGSGSGSGGTGGDGGVAGTTTSGGGSTGGGAAPAPAAGAITVTPSTTGTSRVDTPRVKDDTVSANQVCVGPPSARCSIIYLLQTREYVAGYPGAHAARKKRRSRPVTLGRTVVTLAGGQTRKVTVRLNSKGRNRLKRAGRLKATLVVSERGAGGKVKRLKATTVRFKR